MFAKDKVTAERIGQMKADGKKITALSVYDFAFASIADKAGVDIILVGDSLGMTFQGEENTLKVTMDQMAYHTRAVRRGVKRALVVADMPFMSFRLGEERSLENAARLITEGAEAVKLEGADGVDAVAARMVKSGIPVMGHIGLTPQSVNTLGGYKVQGLTPESAEKLIEDALRLQDAGVFSMVLECTPMEMAARICEKVQVPVIGIGAGPYCDGQILVSNDLLGLSMGHVPKFVKKYAALGAMAEKAMGEFVKETRGGVFPSETQSYSTAPKKPIAL